MRGQPRLLSQTLNKTKDKKTEVPRKMCKGTSIRGDTLQFFITDFISRPLIDTQSLSVRKELG